MDPMAALVGRLPGLGTRREREVGGRREREVGGRRERGVGGRGELPVGRWWGLLDRSVPRADRQGPIIIGDG